MVLAFGAVRSTLWTRNGRGTRRHRHRVREGTQRPRNGRAYIQRHLHHSGGNRLLIRKPQVSVDRPIKDIPEAIVANESLAIDAISGGDLGDFHGHPCGVEDAVKQAGGDAEALRGCCCGPGSRGRFEPLHHVVILAAAARACPRLFSQGIRRKVAIVEKAGAVGGNPLLRHAFNAFTLSAGRCGDEQFPYRGAKTLP